MIVRHRRVAWLAAAAAVALIATGCSSSSGGAAPPTSNSPTSNVPSASASASASGSGSTGASASAGAGASASGSTAPPSGGQSATPEQLANANTGGTPVQGGTLKVIGNADVDHLDSAAGYYTVTNTLMRTFTRQLFTTPASTDPATAVSVVPDVATEMPTVANGGLSADGKTYTIHIRKGVMWNTQPARQVTAQDYVLGFKRLCNPTKNAVGAPGYFIGVIVGMDTYCKGFSAVKADIADFKTYLTTHDISGVKAVDDMTLQFTLVNAASDFPNILTLTFCSAAPVEYLSYLPDDANFRQNTISDGPYQITKYVAGQSYTLAKNPAWTQASDPVHHQYLDGIQVTMGPDESAVQQQIAAGTQDLEWDTTVPTADVPGLKSSNDVRMGIYPNYDTNPFLVFNAQSPNANGALGKVAVRQALEYAVDKVALGKIYGGDSLNTPLNQIIPPGNVGYVKYDPYPTPNDQGDPAKCKQLLAAAGYPNGLTIKDIYRTSGKHPNVYQSIQADFKACGVTTEGVPVAAGDYYGKYLSDPTASKSGSWDISEPGWVPDWFGNNARSVMVPLFDGRTYGPGSTDWSGYNNAQVNADIDKALTSTDPAEVQTAMHDADMQVMKDAVIVPFQTQSTPIFRSSRVHNAIELPPTSFYDWTQIWLSNS